MATEEGGTPTAPKKVARKRSRLKADPAAAVQAAAGSRKKAAVVSPSDGRTSGQSRAEDAQEVNPGLLLGDLVDGQPASLSSTQRPAAASGKKLKRRRATAKIEATQADDELGNLGLGLEDGFGDEDELDTGAEASARLLGMVGRLPTEDTPTVLENRRVQAKPESEFHAGAVDEEVTIEDLLKPLQEAPAFGDVRRQLEGLAKREAMPEPVSEVKRTREERNVQYDATSKDVRKWFPQVHRMQRADQVTLGSEPVLAKSTNEIVGNFKATDDFEKELEEVTKAAGATEEDVKGAKALPMNPRLREEHQTRQVARLKALMMREQQTKKRVNKIKSKTYRRIHRKSENKDREVLLERLEHENPELAKQLKQEYERKHAEKRLLRQRNARKKWTQTMQRFAKGDRDAQQEISKQAQKAHDDEQALRRAIRGQDPDQSDDSEAVDLSGDEEDGKQSETKRVLSKAKKLTVEEIKDLEAEGDLPTKGFLGMKFMRDAIKQKRENAKQEALGVLKELEGMEKKIDDYGDKDSDEESEKGDRAELQAKPIAADAGSKPFTPEELAAARKEVDEMLDQEDNVTGCTVSGPLTIHGVEVAQVSKMQRNKGEAAISKDTSAPSSASMPAAKKASENPWVAENPWNDASVGAAENKSGADKEAQEAEVLPSSTKPGKRKKRKAKKLDAAEVPQRDVPEDNVGMADDLLGALNADSETAREQRELVRTAFVEGTQQDDFEAELEEEDRKKEDKQESNHLPGWGSWAGEGAPKPRQAKAKAKPAAKPAVRPGDKQSHARIFDGKAEASKYFVDKVPYGFQTPEQYDQEMRMPSGPEWNALPSHLQKIKPKFFSKVGAIVPPLQLVRHLPPESREGIIDKWAASKQPKRLKAKI